MTNNDIDAVMKELNTHFHSVKTPIVDLIQAKTEQPFKVLIATILSARTKDETTAKVVDELFKVVNNADDLDAISAEELDRIIYPVGFHNTKTQHLKQLPKVLNEEFGGVVPSEIDDLLKLPGVGRKTANLVRTVAFSLPAICVDVHVHRICNRWGYVKTKNPLETEMALRQKLPKKHWLNINSHVVAFGQNLCKPRKPNCDICPIYKYCKRVGVK
ncbi:MAG: endonuclease III [Candidatus Cloacimonadaceae bacterium]|jgi:endonuclease III|nr:endonuclease III [Candidatus Cloacimonadota bacterium]MDY0127999.1 endonuclease III [Candidatus Cloacimonadaceae bacterium]MCB5255332.1 endonuclease III [Candidatus Cloacimonadota bacterium]MCK9178333.1 endonuclease III [Candidatus Cloacimonadota bacterium]MCK9242307.1 endonuclease III [Candidatus Cloacimonadota bacterium]